MKIQSLVFGLFAALSLVPSVAATELGTDELDALRQEALDLVNQVREENGLESLSLTPTLNEAAQGHAAHMLADDFYAHVSPNGTTPMDRYLEAGGNQWRVVRENIARCANCPVPPQEERLRSFQQGWMNSPDHRENILAEGLDSFGFGVSGEAGEVFAVQMFSGAGTSRGLDDDEQAQALPPDEMGERLAEIVNRLREDGEPLSPASALSAAAQELLPDPLSEGMAIPNEGLFDLLPQQQRSEWRQLQILSSTCGGCGTKPTAQDIEAFVEQWMDSDEYRSILLEAAAGDVGFAMRADGEGQKIGIAIIGR
ncbi:hypothetical protein GCM10007989_21590 [Devosia pacifica]|uniref:SCP domain-containing protein n=2 Tax=Devosia pacifica TaxID=1335967 RepID=A0A918VUZ5_9HYPH|nr:hypothetical protein GCM10007989_21590 [Devosia pacifica]